MIIHRANAFAPSAQLPFRDNEVRQMRKVLETAVIAVVAVFFVRWFVKSTNGARDSRRERLVDHA